QAHVRLRACESLLHLHASQDPAVGARAVRGRSERRSARRSACREAGSEITLIKTGQYVELAGGTRLHYASCGTREERPLVLCVHGFPEYGGAWEDVLPSLGEWSYAVAPDLRGYNFSSQPTGVDAYRAREIVGDLIALIEKLGYARAFIVAHDWGGAAGW